MENAVQQAIPSALTRSGRQRDVPVGGVPIDVIRVVRRVSDEHSQLDTPCRAAALVDLKGVLFRNLPVIDGTLF
jgi:hypothetical protein